MLRHGGGGASAKHCTGMSNLPSTIQYLGTDGIMSLGVKSFAAKGVGTFFIMIRHDFQIPRLPDAAATDEL